MNEIDRAKLLEDMRALTEKAKGISPSGLEQTQTTESFADLLKRAVDGVNEAQKTADDLTQAFETGTAGVDLPQVMVASQKARVAFTAMVEVRNKLLDAYQEIMRMQV